jgi:hypothetical protein
MKSSVALLMIVMALLHATSTVSAAEKLAGTINKRPISCYRIVDKEAAMAEAKAANKPIMWIASKPEYISPAISMKGSGMGNATVHALAAFAERTVIIFHDAFNENHQGPPLVDHALHNPNPHYTPPTVVLLDPEMKRVLKVITYDQDFNSRKETYKQTILELPKLMAENEKKP